MLNINEALIGKEKVLNFERPAPVGEAQSNSGAARHLMSQAVEIMRHAERRVAERQADAEFLATRAIQELQDARARAEFAEAKQRAFAAVIKTVTEKIQSIETAMTNAADLIAEADARALAALKRADLAEMALMRIDKFMGSR